MARQTKTGIESFREGTMTMFKALAGLAISALLMGSAAFAGEIVGIDGTW